MPSAGKGRIPSLDGLRALAVATVFYGHLAGTVGAYRESLFRITGDIGNVGVRAFFVMSGFLITTLLLRERERNGTISLKAFYTRRAMRLLPVFYAFLALAAVLTRLHILHIPGWDFLQSGVFVTNFFDVDWNLGHFWSLAIEEQFYLVWPAILLLAGARRATRFSVVAFLITPMLHVVAFKMGSEPWARLFLSVNALAIGCALAGLRPWLHENSAYMRVLASPLVWPVVFSVWLVSMWNGHLSYVGAAYSSFALAFIIDRVSTFPTGLASVLNFRPVVFVGAISYSLYVWQQLFLDRYSHSPMARFPLNLILAVTCALASYYAIEKPIMRWNAARKTKRAHGVYMTAGATSIVASPMPDLAG